MRKEYKTTRTRDENISTQSTHIILAKQYCYPNSPCYWLINHKASILSLECHCHLHHHRLFQNTRYSARNKPKIGRDEMEQGCTFCWTYLDLSTKHDFQEQSHWSCLRLTCTAPTTSPFKVTILALPTNNIALGPHNVLVSCTYSVRRQKKFQIKTWIHPHKVNILVTCVFHQTHRCHDCPPHVKYVIDTLSMVKLTV